VSTFYLDQVLTEASPFADFHVTLRRPAFRRWVRPQVRFLLDGKSPFRPLPAEQAFALFEWGLNWCVAQHAHRFLMLHAAVAERAGWTVILPGAPGAGKSTLCAALVNRGWRLLSDEFALVSLDDGRLTPLVRPVSLKNESVDVIRRFAPGVVIGPVARDTAKGTVAHMKAPADSIARAEETALPAWIVLPRYRPDAPLALEPHPRAETFMFLAQNAFNYHVLGSRGFEALADLTDRCSCHTLTYASLDEAVATLGTLTPPR